MLSPEYLLRISEGGEALAESLHNDIIKQIVDRIAVRLDRGDNYILTARDKWQIQVLQESGLLREDIQKLIADQTGLMQQEIAEAMEDAGVKAISYDNDIYRAAGLIAEPLEQSPHLIRLMQRAYEATAGEWTNLTRTTADACQQAFVEACDTAYNQVSSGAVGYAQAYVDAINKIAGEGVAVVKYSKINPATGEERVHVDTIETATLRCIRTGVSQATAQITDARMDEMDWDIILVSAHLGARVTGSEDFTNHYWWQGKFYSKSGKDPRFPPYSVCGEGNVQGIHGANCRHSHGPGDGEFNPFEKFDEEANKKENELQQKQRSMERGIRKTKRHVMGLREGVEKATTPEGKAAAEEAYQKESARLQRQNKAYSEFCEENNLKKLNERINIAKWDRSQAAKARAAAKKYGDKSVNLKDIDDNGKNDKNASLTVLSIEEVNKRGTRNLLNAYERRREHFELNMTSADEIARNPYNSFVQDYSGVSVETANAFESTIDKLSKRYYTGLTRVEVGDPRKFFGSGTFASVTPMPTVGANTLTINPLKTKDYTSLTTRIKELSEKGYCVRIPDDKLGEYIATHEFAHTLINLKVDSYKNYVGIDVNYYMRARKEIVNIYDRYISDIGNLEAKKKAVEGRFFLAHNQAELAKIQKEFASIKADLAARKISKYSLENADEFMAESFTDCIIGKNPSMYSKEILEIIDRYWGIK